LAGAREEFSAIGQRSGEHGHGAQNLRRFYNMMKISGKNSCAFRFWEINLMSRLEEKPESIPRRMAFYRNFPAIAKHQ